MDKTDIKEQQRQNTDEQAGTKFSTGDTANDKKMEATSDENSDAAMKLDDTAQASDASALEGDDSDLYEKIKGELETAKDKYLRLYSEFENFRKRTSKEKIELIQSANEQLLLALLPVADDFERAENAFDDKNNKDLAGFFLIHSKFKKVLELYGVRSMEIGQGSDFDADFHEAISQVPAPAPELKGKIVDVVEKGYILNDKVIRYAKVVVGN